MILKVFLLPETLPEFFKLPLILILCKSHKPEMATVNVLVLTDMQRQGTND
jgi:hypothetical protein